MQETELKIIKNIDIRFCEVDQLNVVWHGHYLKYFEDAREAFCDKYNLNFSDFVKEGYITYISKYTVEHKLPLRYKEKIKVEVMFKDCRTCKILFVYNVYNSKNQLACIGSTEQVVIDKEGKLMIDWPDFLKSWKNTFVKYDPVKFE